MTAVLWQLQLGLLIAHKNEIPLERIQWVNKRPQDILSELDLNIFADAAFAIWPELRNVRETTARPKAAPEASGVLESDSTEDQLRPANDHTVHEAITAVYDRAQADKEKPPNVKEIVIPVQAELRALSYYQSGRQIQKLAEAPQHKTRRRLPGATVASEKRQNQA